MSQDASGLGALVDFESLFRLAPHPYLVLACDAQFTILAVNEAYLQATGTRRAMMVGRALFDVFPDNPADSATSSVSDLRISLNRVTTDGRADTMGIQKYDVPHRDGTPGFKTKYWSPINTPIFDDSGRHRWILHHVEDVTDYILSGQPPGQGVDASVGKIEDRLQRMEAEVLNRANQVKEVNRALKAALGRLEAREIELAEAKAQAEAANVAKSAFLANMSHEIRTPLNAVLGLTQLLRRSSLTSKQVEHIDKIELSGKHLLTIINDVLDLSKIEAGKLQLSRRDFDLHATVQSIAGLFAASVDHKGLELCLDAGDAPRYLHGDDQRLSQMLINYIGNAIKFTERGAITLRVVVLERTETGCRLRFEVKDTGIGIREEALPALFEPFVQADNSMTRKFGGTGLGLAITRRMAQLMGGETGVDSVWGQGSTFWVTVPLLASSPDGAGVDAVRPPTSESRLRSRHQGARVLLVEDDAINREVAQSFVELAGLQVDAAANGKVALELARKNSYAAILMDIQMPVMDGLEASRAIRSLPSMRNTPIIALTANAFMEDRDRCMAAGMDDFLSKPFEPDALFDKLLRALERR